MTTSRIDVRLKQTRAEGRAALVAYLMAGDPDLETSFEAMRSLRDNGADIIELGAPFTDPMADGPAIQRAGQRSLAAGTRLTDVLSLARRFRQEDESTPLVLMGYANPIHHFGFEAFANAAADSGIDGVILVDLPPEEDSTLRAYLDAVGIAVIRLATPTTDPERMVTVSDGASGFVYFVSVTGVTGAGAADPQDIKPKIAQLKAISGLPVCVGFGVRTGAQAAEMAKIADGVVVGSAFVEHAARAVESGDHSETASGMGQLAKELSEAISGVASS